MSDLNINKLLAEMLAGMSFDVGEFDKELIKARLEMTERYVQYTLNQLLFFGLITDETVARFNFMRGK